MGPGKFVLELGADPHSPGEPCKAGIAWGDALVGPGWFLGGLAPHAPSHAPGLCLVPCGRAVTAHQPCPASGLTLSLTGQQTLH